jgi:diguanylate cyclase (GGDEF)-like protein
MSLQLDHKKILVVDDVPVNVQLLKTYLSAEGYTVLSAGDGNEAIAQVEEHLPDLILLDVMMPEMNGFEVCKILKSNTDTKFIPVIMVTALNELADKIKGIDSGADEFLSKPFHKLELLARVRSLLRQKELHDELQEKVLELETAREELKQLASTDGLTGLYNYRHFKEHFQQELTRATRHKLNVSLVMMDIDHFKHYNDRNGHPAGDNVLKKLAMLLTNNIRSIDLAARYGGEEFCLVLVETNKDAAKVAAEKIRRIVETNDFEFEETQPGGKLTVSTGVATFPEDGMVLNVLVQAADNRLYLAKQAGRNRVIWEG